MAKYSSSQNNIEVGVNVIPSVDQKGLNDLRNSLDKLFRLNTNDFAKIHPEMDTSTLKTQFKEINTDVKKVRDAFTEAFNTKLGTTDLDKLNNSLKQLDMQKIGESFNSLGSQGSKAFAQMAKEMTTVNFQFKESTKWFTEFKDSLANTARWAATSSIVNGITNSVRQAWEYSVKLDTALNDIRIVSGKSAEDMDHFAQRANDAAQALGKSTKDYAEAALIYYQQGDTDEVAQAKADVTLKAANVTGQSTQEVSEQLTAVWNGYKVDAQEAELYVDKLAAVAATTASDLEELSTGMSKVASAANAMGVDVDQLNAQLATIVSVTRQAPESVGVALKTVYSRMTDIQAGLDTETTLGNYSGKMAEFGINVLDANGKLRDMGDVIEEIGGKWESLSREQQVALAQAMAGTRQYNNLLALFENFDQYNDALATSQNSMGTLQEQQDIYMESTKAHLETLGAAWERIYDDIIDSKGINNLIDTFTLLTNGLGNFIEAIGGSSGALTALGVVGLRVFKDNISDSIATAISNSKKLKENLIQIQKAEENQQLLEAQTKGASQKSIEGIKERNRILFDASKKGTISNQDFIEGQKISNEVADKQIELETFENQVFETVQRIQNAVNTIDLFPDEEEDITKFLDSLKSDDLQASDIESAFEENETVIKSFFQTYREQIEQTREILRNFSSEIEKAFPERSGLDDEQRYTPEKYDKYKEYIEKAQRLTNNENISDKQKDKIKKDLENLYTNFDSPTSRANFSKILNSDEGYDNLTNNLKALKRHLDNAAISLDNCGESMENTFNKSMKNGFNIINQGNADLDQANAKWKFFAENIGDKGIADNIVGLTSGFGELGLALQSVLNLPSIWTSEDLSDGEKLVQIIFSVTTALGGLYDGIKTIKAAEMGETFKQLGAKIGETILDKSNKGGIGGAISTFLGGDALKNLKDLKKATDDSAEGIKKVTKSGEGLKNTSKNFNAVKEGAENSGKVIGEVAEGTESLGLVAGTAFLKVTLIVAAIAAIGYGIYAIVNRDKLEMQGLQTELENTQKTAADVQQKYSELSQTWTDYKSAKDSLKDIEKGTLEWYDAISKVNEKAQELIEKLNLIAGQDYSIGESGEINFDEERLEDRIYEEQQRTFQAQANIFSQQAEIAEKETNNLIRDFKNNVNKQVLEQLPDAKNVPQLTKSGAKDILEGKTSIGEGDLKFVDGTGTYSKKQDYGQYFINITGELKDFKSLYLQKSQQLLEYQRSAVDMAIKGNISKSQLEEYEKLPTVSQETIQDYVKQSMANSAKDESFDLDYSDWGGFQWVGNILEWFGKNQLEPFTGIETDASYYSKEYLKDSEGYSEKDGKWYDKYDNPVSDKEVEEKIKNYSLDLIEKYYQSGQKAIADSYEEIQSSITKNTQFALDSKEHNFSQNEADYIGAGATALMNGNKNFDFSLISNEGLDYLRDTVENTGAEVDQDMYNKLMEATHDVVKRTQKDTEDYNNTLKQSAEELDTTEDALQIYGAAMRNAGSVEADKNKQTAESIASNYEFNKSYNETQEILYDNIDAFKDYKKAVKNHEDISYDIADAMGELKENLEGMFDGADISAEVFQDNLDTIEKLLTGTKEEAEEAYETLNQEIQLDALKSAFQDTFNDIETRMSYTGQAALNMQQQLVDAINSTDPGGTLDERWGNALANMVNNSNMTATEIETLFSQLNLSPPPVDIKYPETEVSSETVEFTSKGTTTAHRYKGEMPNPRFLNGEKDQPETIQVDYAWIETVEDKTEEMQVPKINGSGIKVNNNARSNGGGTMGGRNFTPSQANKSNRSPSRGSKSPSSGSSSQPKDPDHMDPLEKEKDRYHDINIELKETQTQLDRLDKQKKKLFGQKLIDNINKQIGQLNDKIAETNQKIGIARNEVGELQAKLGAKGVAFAADGDIANYASAWQAQYNYVQSLINNYNGMSAEAQEKYKDTVENAKKDFDEFEKNIQRYDTLISEEIPGLEDDIQDAIDEKIDLQIEAFNMEIEIRLDLAEAERDWNEFKKKVIDGIDEDDILGNARARLEDFWSYYKEDETGVIQRETAHLNDLLNQLRQIDATGTSSVYGDNKAQAMEDLKEYYEQLMEDLEGVVDLQEEVHEAYLDMMDEAQDKFDQQLDTFEQIADIIEHNMDLINLVYGEESYGALSGYYDRMEENYNKQVDFQRQQVVFWQEQMNTLEEGSEEWEQARDNWMDAVGDWRDTVNDAIENLQDKYLNTINDIFQRLNDHVTDGKGLEYVNEEWELINKNADEYLDTVNAMYGIQKLEKKYLDALDQTDSISVQRQIKELMDAELEDLRSRDKLTEYDIERAEKKYEIMLKQIALQEAQENKSKMRLRRDSQGNYTYQYVADDDAIGDLQDELSDMYNDLYNFDKDRYQQNLDSLYEIWAEFQEKMAEAAQINDPVARAERELLIKQQYEELINGIVDQNQQIRKNLYESAFQDLADLYNTDVENFNNMLDSEKEALMEGLIPYWDSGIQHMADVFAGEDGFLGVCRSAFEELKDATWNYENSLDELEDTAGVDFGEIADNIDDIIDATEELLWDNEDLIDSYREQLNAIQQVISLMETLISKYNTATQAAKNAASAAYDYWQMENRAAAAVAQRNKALMDSVTTGVSDAMNKVNSMNARNSGGGGRSGDGQLSVGDTATLRGSYYYDSYGVNPSGSLYSGVTNGVVVDKINNNPFGVHIHSADGRYGDLGWVKRSQLSGYDTGGYTGEWNSKDGKLALLHEKELVLNKQDTKNLLSAIEIMRDITDSFNTTMLNKLKEITATKVDSNILSDTLEQNVHIDASFPNVESSREIEEALNNLVNMASMRIGRR